MPMPEKVAMVASLFIVRNSNHLVGQMVVTVVAVETLF
jgi:hypothetical protein